MKHALLHNQTHPLEQTIQAAWCDAFFCRLRGLMFRPSMAENEGLIMVQTVEDRVNAAIHMFFMNFDIAVIWLDHDLRVVDRQLARRWRPMYTPANKAKYVLELHPNRLDDFNVGDQIVIEPCEK